MIPSDIGIQRIATCYVNKHHCRIRALILKDSANSMIGWLSWSLGKDATLTKGAVIGMHVCMYLGIAVWLCEYVDVCEYGCT